MLWGRCARVVCGLLVGGLLLAVGTAAGAQEKTIKIGVIYDLTGPFAGGGSELHYDGAKIMIDWFNAHGGIDGYKVDAVYADAQSKPDVAINEAVRLIEQEKVDMLLGLGQRVRALFEARLGETDARDYSVSARFEALRQRVRAVFEARRGETNAVGKSALARFEALRQRVRRALRGPPRRDRCCRRSRFGSLRGVG